MKTIQLIACFITATLHFLPFPIFAQREPWQQAESFMRVFERDGFATFIDSTFDKNPAVGKNALAKIKMDGETSLGEDKLGKLLGYDFLSDAVLGGRLASITYMVRTELTPISFRFVFYKPDDRWIIKNFEYSSKVLDDEIEQIEAWKRQATVNQ